MPIDHLLNVVTTYFLTPKTLEKKLVGKLLLTHPLIFTNEVEKHKGPYLFSLMCHWNKAMVQRWTTDVRSKDQLYHIYI